MKNTVLKGSLILVLAGVLGKALGAFYRIPLSNILSAEGMGIYQMIFPVFSLALILCSGGVSVTVAHSIAKIRASGQGNQKKVFLQGLFYSLITSLIFAVVFICLGDQISALQGNEMAGSGYKMVSLALVFASLISSLKGFFQGYQNMLPTATSQILEQVFKVAFGLVFSYFFTKNSIELGVVGAFLGIGIAEIISFLYLIFKIRKVKFSYQQNEQPLRKFLVENLSITLSFLIIPIITAFDSFVVVNILKESFSVSTSTALYGIQSGMVTSLINFPVIISIAVSLALLPDLSFEFGAENYNKISEKVSNVFFILFVILSPCVIIFISFANEIMGVLYSSLNTNLLNVGVVLLQVSAVSVLFISVLQISTTIFQSMDKPLIPIFTLAFSGVIKIVLTIVLVGNPEYNILGLAISNLIFYVIAGLVSLYIVRKKISFQISSKQMILTLIFLLVLAGVFYLTNVYISSLLLKIIFVILECLLFYVLPIFIFNIANIKVVASEFLRKRKINE